MVDATAPPTNVDIDKERSVTLTWLDGPTTRLSLAELRAACPCAWCRNLREAGTPVWAGPGLRVEAAELVGNWGLQIHWSDGHGTGIYPWGLLRSMDGG